MCPDFQLDQIIKPDQKFALKYANRLPSVIYFHINKPLNLHTSLTHHTILKTE